MKKDAGIAALRTMKVGESIARVRRIDIKKYNVEDIDTWCRNQQTAIGVSAARLPEVEITTERFEALTRSREHIVIGVVATRVA